MDGADDLRLRLGRAWVRLERVEDPRATAGGPLTAHPGHTTRFYVVDAGPSLHTAFHVVGTILRRAWVDGAVTDPPEHGVQTVTVPAGGGAIFDVNITKPGLYPFVTHSFASVDMGAVGLLKVGEVEGTMSH